jgi:hypothetical protein
MRKEQVLGRRTSKVLTRRKRRKKIHFQKHRNKKRIPRWGSKATSNRKRKNSRRRRGRGTTRRSTGRSNGGEMRHDAMVAVLVWQQQGSDVHRVVVR